MPLICNMGFHRAHPFPRWHNGFYLSNCKRCGERLARTAYEGWKVQLQKSKADGRFLPVERAPTLRSGAIAASLLLATGAITGASLGLADRRPTAPPSQPVPAPLAEPKVSVPQTSAMLPSATLATEDHRQFRAAAVVDPKDSPQDASAEKRDLQPLGAPSKRKAAKAPPPKPAKAKIKYRYSANMRLFCQRAGRHTAECRVFRQQTASSQRH